ncbi:leucyl aminopeptidase [Motiliproteus sp. SC1-56]|uniref:leucyl aminopeptidase n=1 Tax=Motiliproteus sp. SC1-56 TaxID=2799565 RepID=UPI001A90055E|nr:leucyl aminopeptidase [Motiliproteus sp. SC1-56]
MEFEISSDVPQQLDSECLVVAIGEGSLTAPARALDEASQGAISQVIEAGDIKGKKGQTMLLRGLPGVKARRVLLLGLGTDEQRNDSNFQKGIKAALTVLKSINCTEATFCLDDAAVNDRDCYWRTRQLVEQAVAELYRFEQMKSKPGDPLSLARVRINLDEADVETGEVAISEGAALANGVSTARDLGNLPANVCTPRYLADQARELAEQHPSLSCQVLEEDEMRKLGMGSLLSVTAGTEEPAQLIVLEYRGASEGDKPHVLVGKGITFDSGGISLKPGEAMDEMKYDMCGAASVLGTMTAVAEMGLPLNVVAVIAAAENLPSGHATKPGDIVTSMSGQTIEILNTDAEGRLVLCDALTYVARFNPASVVDVATLTGACILALGHKASGLLSNDDGLAGELLDAAAYTTDKAWRLPLWDDYQEQLDSNFADMQNIGGRPAGTITAACFLSRFTKEYRWAHLDIAGTAWQSGKQKGATGRCVPLLTQYLIDRTA